MKFSLRKILIFSFILVILCALSFSLIQRYIWLSKHERETMMETQLPIAKSLARIVELQIKQKLELISVVAKEISRAGLSPKRTQSIIESVHFRNPYFSTIFVCDSKGRVMAAFPLKNEEGISNIGINLSDRSYFQESKMGKPNIGSSIRERLTRRYIIPFSVPIKDKAGNFSGIIVGGYPAEPIQEIIESYKSSSYYIGLLDREGRLVARSEHEGIKLQDVIMTDFSKTELVKRVKAEKKGITEYISPITGVKKLSAFYGLDNGYTAYISRSIKDIKNTVFSSFYWAIFWAIIDLVIAFGTAYSSHCSGALWKEEHH